MGFLVTTFAAVAAIAAAGTISGNVADYNAAEVAAGVGALTVPAGLAKYTVTTTVPIGSSFTVTLPSGFSFSPAPTLTTSGTSTFLLTSLINQQSATFSVQTADLTSGQTVSLASFVVVGASALGTVTPVANALPITMQAVGIDPSPLSFKAFASDVGAAAAFIGTTQFIDTTAPSNGTKFNGGLSTVVLSEIFIQAQSGDAATNTAPILNPDGSLNSISNTDTATVKMFMNTGGITKVFSSPNPACTTQVQQGTVNSGNVTVPNIPVNTPVFFCVTAGGGVLQSNLSGITAVTVAPGTSIDFLSAAVNIIIPGEICYSNGTTTCITWAPPQSAVPTPTLSEWGMIGLGGMIVLLGFWKLNRSMPPV